MRSLRSIAGFAAIVLACGACAAQPKEAMAQVQERLETSRAVMTPLVGVATESDFVRRYGAPDTRFAGGGGETWKYTGAERGGHERLPCDELTLRFDAGGVLESWHAFAR